MVVWTTFNDSDTSISPLEFQKEPAWTNGVNKEKETQNINSYLFILKEKAAIQQPVFSFSFDNLRSEERQELTIGRKLWTMSNEQPSQPQTLATTNRKRFESQLALFSGLRKAK